MLVDTNVLVRHVTADPPDQARRATAFLHRERELILTDVIVTEVVYVLQSFYGFSREQVVWAIRSLITRSSIVTADQGLLLRSAELYEDGLDFVDAYLAASAEHRGIGRIASFDRGFDRIPSIERIEP